jgi:hypothetical protein
VNSLVYDNSNLPAFSGEDGGASPFDGIRRTDAYGREYWAARDLQLHMGYEQWRRFEDVVERAVRAALNTSTYTESAFAQVTELADGGNLGMQERKDYHLSRYAAYLVAMNGDPRKGEVAAAQAYFAVRAREAELGALATEEIRATALARAREMVDYKIFRDMMADNAPDYEPSNHATQMFFAIMQNKLYRHITGMDAQQIRSARPLCNWPGREQGKPEPGVKNAARKIAKNYLAAAELGKLDRLVSRLCLRAEDIAEDDLHLSLTRWEGLVDAELAMAARLLPGA